MSRPRKPPVRHGFVIIDKPTGWTSHDVVARVRRIVEEKRVGHAGTLDPSATGVLPVAVGNATRAIEYLAEADKAYTAEVTFGVVTDSADREGEMIATADATHLTRDAVEAAVATFQGPLQQVPPMHSAIKVDGKRLYEHARKGETIDIEPRQVTIHEIRVVGWQVPVATIEVTCSKGTYIRSLARDIGERLGTGAHLSALRRTRVGSFGLDKAISLDDLAARGFDAVAMPPDTAMSHLPRLDLSVEASADWREGRTVPAPGATGTLRVYDASGAWVGVGQAVPYQDRVRPVKVVHPPAQVPA